MKIVMQHLKTGETFLEELPIPFITPNSCLIQSTCSLISPGTEKMLVQFGKANIVEKIQQQPDKVKQVLDKILNDGLFATLDAVNSKLEQPIALGYSSVGVIHAVGNNVHEFQIGDRVVSNGYHAEFNLVSKNLCVKIPDHVSDEEASFTLLGAIALQGIRLAKVELGEKMAVIGLGLIGLLTCQILKANGCEVIGIDVSTKAIEKAESLGILCYNSKDSKALDLYNTAFAGIGVDGVLITASSKDHIINYAAEICRTRGRIVLLGVVGNEIKRDLFYKKELQFQVSCSYGPGRYDPSYEDKGIDYPIGFVRWTEKRNMEAVLQLMQKRLLNLNPLISSRTSFEFVIEQCYQKLDELQYGNIIQYTAHSVNSNVSTIEIQEPIHSKQPITIGMIGSGSFSASILLPVIRKFNPNLKILISNQAGAAALAKKFGFQKLSSDSQQIWDDPEINLVIIANRHHLHGKSILKALACGKDIFIEKPLTIFKEELELIKMKLNSNNRIIVGYNRRFSEYIQKIMSVIKPYQDQLCISYLINAGHIDSKHWVQDPEFGGGRILGELCHFVDLCNYLINSEVTQVQAISQDHSKVALANNVSVQLKYQNGSIASIQYFSNGSKKLPKENIKLFFGGNCIELNNFKSIKSYGLNVSTGIFSKQDKGYEQQFKEVLNPISDAFGKKYQEQIIHTSEVCFQIIEKLQMNSQIG